MSKVYICTGSCEGQSEQPGTCQADVCERKGMPLEEMTKCDKCGAMTKPGEAHSCSNN